MLLLLSRIHYSDAADPKLQRNYFQHVPDRHELICVVHGSQEHSKSLHA